MSSIGFQKMMRKRYPDLLVVLACGYSHLLAKEGRHGFELIQKPYAAVDVARILGAMSA